MRERILHTAADLFHKRGFKSTTVREIGEAVGLLSGSLFHHFASKEAMLVEIVREAAASVCMRAEALSQRGGPPANLLRALIRLELEAITLDSRRTYFKVLLSEWRDVPAHAKPELDRLRKRYQRCWRDALEACHAEGQLRCPPAAAERILHGALRGAITWFSADGTYSAEEFGDTLAHLLLE
jgi:AcrR family transcriptional regulator